MGLRFEKDTHWDSRMCENLGQGRRKIDNWGGGHIHIIVFTVFKNRVQKQLILKSKLLFQKKLIVQNTNI